MTRRVHLALGAANVEADLLTHLLSGSTVEINCWALSADDEGQVWLTNPYGVDVMVLPLSEAGCRSAMTWVRSDDDAE